MIADRRVCAVALAFLVGCGPNPASNGGGAPLSDPVGPPDVLLVTLDTFRADHTGCLGNPNGLTPAIDRALRPGRIARDAYAPAPLTSVSHASMLTGLEPPTHGVRENGLFELDPGIPTLGTYLGEHGFRTAAFVSAFPLEQRFGFDSGFDRYDDALGGDAGSVYYAERSALETTDAAIAWLDSLPPEQRWFAWVHYFDPHHPRVFPPELRAFPGDDYDREVRETDRQFGRLLRHTQVWGGGRLPVLAVISDHGEGQGDHRELSHGILLYDELLRGVFGLAAPAGSEERARLGTGTLPGVVRYTDLVPTLFEVLDLPFHEGIDGRSLLSEAVADPTDGAYGETYYPALHYHWSPLLSWRTPEWTYIHGPNPELFDRVADPGETRNVIADHADVAAALDARIQAIARDPDAASSVQPDQEAQEKLSALGYLSTTADFHYDATKDPNQLIGSANALFRGITLLSQRQPQAALGYFQRAYRADPENVSALFYLANTFRELGDSGTAMGYYRRAVDLEPRAAEAHAHLAILEFDAGRRDEAFALLDRGRAASPGDFSLLMTSGDLYRDAGNAERAREWFERAAESAADRPEPWVRLAQLAAAQGDRAEGERLWQRAAELAPEHPMVKPGLDGGNTP